MLDILHNEFEKDADKIPNWRKMSKYSLAKGYIDNEDNKILRDAYFSAFALRYWHEIPTLYRECNFLVNKLHWTMEDVADLYFEALSDVFKYRAFMKPDVFTYIKDGDEDKFINGYVYRAIDSTRERYFQYYNTGKRAGVFTSHSLDSLVDENGDSLLADNSTSKYRDIDKLIKNLIKENNIYEALVVYTLAYCDVYTKVYQDGIGKAICKSKKVMKSILDLTDDEVNYFIDTYADNKDIKYDVYKYRYYSKSWNSLLYKNALEKLRNNEELKAICFSTY